MSKTPEGRVKHLVRELLDSYKGMWYYMPVPSGYGRQTIDFLGCFRGHFFGVETKAAEGVVTRRQEDTLRAIIDAGGIAFVIEGEAPSAFVDLAKWLELIARTTKYVPLPDPPANRRTV